MVQHATDIPTRHGPPRTQGRAHKDDAETEQSVAHLVIIQHPSRAMLARRFRIVPGTPVTLGRDPSRDICLDEGTVSRLHAEILFEGSENGAIGHAIIRDARSVNGTFRNDRPVDFSGARLEHGDILGLGPSVRLKFFEGQGDELAYHKELAKLAHTDALTGAASAATFLEQLTREFHRARRYERQLSLIVLDVDEFKHINDTWGHPAGDAALAKIVSLCQSEVRSEETIGRLGGDEFAILCPETTGAAAHLLAERLRERVSKHRLEQTQTTPPIPLSCSWGVGTLAPDMITVTDLRKAADAALYEAKRGGRNRVG